MADYLQVHAERRRGLRVVRITGDLDTVMAEVFADRAAAAMRAPEPVLVDLSGLTFIDAHGARALAAVIRNLPAGRLAAVRGCAPPVRRALRLLGLRVDYRPAEDGTAPQSGTSELAGRARRARLDAGQARSDARRVLARLTDTGIRLASTRERTGLALERTREAVASSRAALEHVARSRHTAAT